MNPTFSTTPRDPQGAQPARPASSPFARIGATTGGLLLAVALAVTAAGGSYAYLSQSAEASPGTTMKSGTATLAVTTPLAIPGDKFYPGLTLAGTATVKNTGDVPLALAVSGVAPATPNALLQSLTIGVSVVSSAALCTSSTSPSWTGTFASAAAGGIGSTLAVGATGIVCVTVTLPSSAPVGTQQIAATDLSILIDGTQA